MKHFLLALVLGALSIGAKAVTIDFQTVPLTINSNSLAFSQGSISATITAYQTEFADSSSTSNNTTYGPFGTGTAYASASFIFPVFGRTTLIGTGVDSGLGMYSNEDLGQTEDDETGSTLEPGFDNIVSGGSVLEEKENFQFALFAFDAPVNLSQVIVDDVSNFGRSIWVAGGNTAPDFSGDFLSAFSGFTFINSEDAATDGFFTHNIGPLNNVSYIAIGAPPSIGDLGPILQGGGAQFYIEELNVTPVPIPAAVWLFGSALGILGWRRRKGA